tara:strand:- start:172 stop:300 length:129 start_codon:yes stop_codon:yes gene_type:complete
MNTLQNSLKVPKTAETVKSRDFKVFELAKSEKSVFFVHNYSF